MNTLHFGDNLQVLRDSVRDESVDLIYLDPPFNSNATYNLLFEESAGLASDAQIEAFRDIWEWGDSAADAYDSVMRASGDVALVLKGLKAWLGQSAMMAYLAMMAARLLHLRRALKPTGSLYLHCDPKASHYLKLVLDSVFGHENFQNEIIWKRTSAHRRGRCPTVRSRPIYGVTGGTTMCRRGAAVVRSRPICERHKDDGLAVAVGGVNWVAQLAHGGRLRLGKLRCSPWAETLPLRKLTLNRACRVRLWNMAAGAGKVRLRGNAVTWITALGSYTATEARHRL